MKLTIPQISFVLTEDCSQLSRNALRDEREFMAGIVRVRKSSVKLVIVVVSEIIKRISWF